MALPAWATADADGRFGGGDRRLAWAAGLNGLAGLFQLLGSLVSTLILSRLLGPEDFGIYGMVLPVVAVLMLLADGGSVYHTLRSPRVEEPALTASFWYGLALSCVLSLFLIPLAPALAAAMAEPRVAEATLVTGLAIGAIGLGFQHNALILRCFRTELRALTIILSVTLSVAAAVLAAWLGAGYWALVVLFLGRTALQTALAWWLTGWRPGRPRPLPGHRAEIRRLGLPELYGRVLLSLIRDADKLLVGVAFSTATTGFYALAHMLCYLPLRQVLAPVTAVVIPYLSEHKAEPASVFDRAVTLFALFITALWPGAVFCALYAEPIMGVIVGEAMAGAGAFVPPLLIAGVLSMSGSFLSTPFQALDRPGRTARHNTELLAILVLCLGAALAHGSALAIGYGVLAANLISLVLRSVDFVRFSGLGRRAFAPLLGPLAATALVPGLVVALDRGFGWSATFGGALLVVGVALTLYGLSVALLHGRTLRRLLSDRR